MKMVPVTAQNIADKASIRCYRKAINVVEEFIQSDNDAVELVWEPNEYSSVSSAYGTYSKAAKSMKANCLVFMRQGKVYMVKRGPGTQEISSKIREHCKKN